MLILQIALGCGGTNSLIILAPRCPKKILGHKSIQHTVRYSKLATDRFRDFWRD